ncbi:hypothetical protein L3X38_044319 [Prunus dulcis]|uniref:Uncharacterized protein n=1 Tax=Prunus dulcis TaxID=3755 RepID=A0AAD4YNT3_PRUDU|nr:hypothetical protein L3X38_044319 [Prunus dulcis]
MRMRRGGRCLGGEDLLDEIDTEALRCKLGEHLVNADDDGGSHHRKFSLTEIGCSSLGWMMRQLLLLFLESIINVINIIQYIDDIKSGQVTFAL